MLRPWDLKITLEKSSLTPAWQQIANALIEAIRRGRLPPGTALPGTRDMAARVGVNRKTVQQSYDELIAQGWLTAETTRGTFVSSLLPVVEPEPVAAPLSAVTAFPLRRHAPDLPEFLAAGQGRLAARPPIAAGPRAEAMQRMARQIELMAAVVDRAVGGDTVAQGGRA